MGWNVKVINIQCGCNTEYLVKEVNSFIHTIHPSQVKVDTNIEDVTQFGCDRKDFKKIVRD